MLGEIILIVDSMMKIWLKASPNTGKKIGKLTVCVKVIKAKGKTGFL